MRKRVRMAVRADVDVASWTVKVLALVVEVHERGPRIRLRPRRPRGARPVRSVPAAACEAVDHPPTLGLVDWGVWFTSCALIRASGGMVRARREWLCQQFVTRPETTRRALLRLNDLGMLEFRERCGGRLWMLRPAPACDAPVADSDSECGGEA